MAPSLTADTKAMLKAVALASICHAVSAICQRHYWANIVDHLETNLPHKIPDNDPRSGKADALDAQSYYTDRLPKLMLSQLPLLLLDYHWQCWLERMLPTRPHGAGLTAQEREKITDGDEMAEEEMMRRLIAKGKVRRVSISWCNLFLKWVLENTIAALVFRLLFRAMWAPSDSFRPQPVTAGVRDFILGNLIGVVLQQTLSIEPLVCLINLAVIPVQHRLPFKAALNLAWHMFIAAFLASFVPWIVQTDIVQRSFRNATEKAWRAHNETMNTNITLPVIGASSRAELK